VAHYKKKQLEEIDTTESEPNDNNAETDMEISGVITKRKHSPETDTTRPTKAKRTRQTKREQVGTSLEKYVDYFIEKDKEQREEANARREERRKERQEDVQLRRELLSAIRALCEQK
jgi:hypothetical protein